MKYKITIFDDDISAEVEYSEELNQDYKDHFGTPVHIRMIAMCQELFLQKKDNLNKTNNGNSN